jgi:hypothetical protein
MSSNRSVESDIDYFNRFVWSDIEDSSDDDDSFTHNDDDKENNNRKERLQNMYI